MKVIEFSSLQKHRKSHNDKTNLGLTLSDHHCYYMKMLFFNRFLYLTEETNEMKMK